MIKTLSIAMFLLISINGIKKINHQSADYIRFLHTATVNNHVIPLYISTKKISIQLDSEEYNYLKNQLKGLGKALTPEIEDLYIKSQNNFIVTDGQTYSKLTGFIYLHKDDYNKGVENENEYYNKFSIYINNRNFFLFNKPANYYFYELINYLVSENCDENVINALRRL